MRLPCLAARCDTIRAMASCSGCGAVLIAALALYGFYTSLGGRPAFGCAVLEE
jgi:hypothetical protein